MKPLIEPNLLANYNNDYTLFISCDKVFVSVVVEKYLVKGWTFFRVVSASKKFYKLIVTLHVKF